MFEVNGWTKTAEEDTYSNGCIGRGAISSDNSMRFTGHTVNDIISALMEFTGVNNRDAVLLDACDEEGRIDIQLLETAEGYPATKKEIEQWRNGKLRLWLCDYSFRVEQVIRQRISLAA